MFNTDSSKSPEPRNDVVQQANKEPVASNE